VVITDKECTDKTYPEFWDDISNCLGVQVKAVTTVPSSSSPVSSNDTSVVLVGMRCSGKTTLGRSAAQALSWKFIDLDEVMELQEGKSCGDIVKEIGWDNFRRKEETILKTQLQQHPLRAVIATGGGVIEGEGARVFLSSYPRVIHVYRSIDDIEHDLEGGETARRPAYDVSVRAVFDRRLPLYKEARDYVFAIATGVQNYHANHVLSFFLITLMFFLIHRRKKLEPC
jgi:pentafunctional AROM polypeptide